MEHIGKRIDCNLSDYRGIYTRQTSGEYHEKENTPENKVRRSGRSISPLTVNEYATVLGLTIGDSPKNITTG